MPSCRSARIALACLTLFMASAATAADRYTARVNYMLYCQGCHLPDGAGTPGKIPALKDEVGRFLRVAGGREYLVRVPGTSQSPLTNQQVADVLNWILLNFSREQLPANFIPFSGKEVARYRQKPLTNAGAARARLLQSLGSQNAVANGSGEVKP